MEVFLLNKETLLTLVYQIIANDCSQIICLSEVSAIIDRRAVDVLSTILSTYQKESDKKHSFSQNGSLSHEHERYMVEYNRVI